MAPVFSAEPKPLADILYTVPLRSLEGNPQTMITGITSDSRRVRPGYVFVCVVGERVDGHDYIAAAAAAGALAVVVQRRPNHLPPGLTIVEVPDTAHALGWMAANFYANPSRHLTLVGTTGTNGKTTVSTLLYRLFMALGHTCGLLSTVENRIGQQVYPATHTTPDPVSLQAFLAEARAAGCTHVFMEVSSHAVVQQRIAGCHFAGGVFTNITHDHLDYHGTFANYLKAKQTFFTGLPATAFALSNLDDRNGEVMLQNTSARRHYYALHRAAAQYRLRILEHQLRGMLVEYRQHELWLQLTGQFNAYNVLAVLAVADLLGEDLDATLVAASLLTPAPGRLDIQAYAGGYYAAVDYAHTPDALLNVLNTVNEIRPENGRLITVVGCGGDRDTAKRPEMGRIAADLSDHVILTSDNPRTEDPLRILADIRAGITASRLAAVETLPDRQAAIERAVELARPGDLVVVAGKGHETYQEIAGHRYPFDDRQVLHEAFARKTGGSFGASATAASTDPETRT